MLQEHLATQKTRGGLAKSRLQSGSAALLPEAQECQRA